MIEILKLGGMPMIFVLLFAGGTNVAAVRMLMTGDPRRVATIRSLSTATIFISVAAVLAGVAAVLTKVPEMEVDDLTATLLAGVGESLVNGIIGFALIGLAWAIAAMALRRTIDA